MHFYAKEISSCARHFTEVPERLQTGEDWSLRGWGEAFTGAIIFARDRNRLRSDRTGLREVQQGFICAQKSCTPTQVRITRVSLSSSQAPWHSNPGDVPDGQQNLGIQHRLLQVLLLQLSTTTTITTTLGLLKVLQPI